MQLFSDLNLSDSQHDSKTVFHVSFEKQAKQTMPKTLLSERLLLSGYKFLEKQQNKNHHANSRTSS